MARFAAPVVLLAAATSAQEFPAYAMATHLLVPFQDVAGPVTADDLDGDGIVDLVASSGTGGVIVSLGVGDGTFLPAQLTAGTPAPYPAVHDVTGDGQADVVALMLPIDDSPIEVAVYQNASAGALLPPVTSTVTVGDETYFEQPASFGDIDGDGLADMLVGITTYITPALPGSGAVIVHNQGSSAFGDPTEILGAPVEFWTSTQLADVDADGDLDVVVLRDTPQPPMKVFVNDGTGSLQSLGTSGTIVGYSFGLTLADLDSDGFTDAIVATQGGMHRNLLRGAGDGTFDLVSDEDVPASYAPLVADVNDDAILDLVSTGSTDGQPFLFVTLGTAPFAFQPAQAFALGNSLQLLALDHVDADGFVDAILTAGGGEVIILRGLIGGGFLTPQRATDIGAPLELALADADLDGDVDVFAAHQTGVAVSLLTNDDGALAPGVPLGLGQWAQHVVAGDLDGDGWADAIDDLGPGYTIAAWRNMHGNPPTFAGLGDIGPGDAEVLVLGDIEPDGDLDLVATRRKAGKADVFLGHGDGTFAMPQTLAVGTRALDAVVADLDADGHPDVAVAAGDDGQITWFTGEGSGSLGAPMPIPAGMSPDRLAQADLDGDGILDLAASSRLDKTVVTFRGLGGGTFATADTEFDLGKSQRLLVLDVDRDGVPDLATAAPKQERIGVLRGIGDATLDPVRELVATVGANDIAAADFDADGYPDIVATTAQPPEIWVHFNLAPPFASLGFALAASYGTPNLLVTGEPVANTAVSFTVSGVPPQIPGFLFTGLSTAYLPYKGGTFVPSPDVAIAVLSGVPLTGRWPAGLEAGAAVYFQAWLQASGGETSATQAVVGVGQ